MHQAAGAVELHWQLIAVHNLMIVVVGVHEEAARSGILAHSLASSMTCLPNYDQQSPPLVYICWTLPASCAHAPQSCVHGELPWDCEWSVY